MFSYLAEIVALTFLGFGSIYPLLLWLTPKALIDEGFYRFNQGMVSIVIAIGMIFIYISLTQYNNTYIGVIFISFSIIAIVFFSMILGHWYLNVIQLPIHLLKNSIKLFSSLLMLRLFWNIYALINFEVVDDYGIVLSIISFLWTFEGVMLLVAIFFGIIIPILLNILIWNTLQIHSTQSATGLIYVSVVSILFGDLFYKYYAFRYGIIL